MVCLNVSFPNKLRFLSTNGILWQIPLMLRGSQTRGPRINQKAQFPSAPSLECSIVLILMTSYDILWLVLTYIEMYYSRILHVSTCTAQYCSRSKGMMPWCHESQNLASSLDGRGIRTDPESQSRLSFKPFLRFKVFPNLRRHRRHLFLKRGNRFFQSRKKHPLALPMCWLSSFLPKMSRTSAFTILADTVLVQSECSAKPCQNACGLVHFVYLQFWQSRIQIRNFRLEQKHSREISIFTEGWLFALIGVCLKIVYPYTQWLMIIIPTTWLFHWGYTPFSDIPIV